MSASVLDRAVTNIYESDLVDASAVFERTEQVFRPALPSGYELVVPRIGTARARAAGWRGGLFRARTLGVARLGCGMRASGHCECALARLRMRNNVGGGGQARISSCIASYAVAPRATPALDPRSTVSAIDEGALARRPSGARRRCCDADSDGLLARRLHGAAGWCCFSDAPPPVASGTTSKRVRVSDGCIRGATPHT